MARHEQTLASPRDRAGLAFWLAVVWTTWWAGLTLLFLGMAVFQWTGLDPQPDSDAALGGAVTAVLTGGLAASGVVMARGRRGTTSSFTYRRPDLASVPPSRVRVEQRHRLPRPGSAARQPVRQLAQAESALAEVLRQLGDSADVADAWRAATDTAANLRAAGAKLEAVELAARQLRPPERGVLQDGARDLLTRIEQGLDAYRGLIAAAGRVLLATTPIPAGGELAEETERLAAVAEALRELSHPE